jgi:hypothetical protein
MTVEALLLVVTTLIAMVAVIAAVVAVRAVRELKNSLETVREERRSLHSSPTEGMKAEIMVADARPVELEPGGTARCDDGLAQRGRVVHGRVIVPPTQSQVVRTALGRPGVRLSIVAHGVARALRAENRDRIVALMRREYRHRRRERLRSGRQAIRMARPTSAPSTDRLHEHLLEPEPRSLTDRMIRS